MKTKTIATRAIFTIVILLTIVTIAAAQVTGPGGGGGQGQEPPPGTNPVPIDPASWLIPAGMGAYAWYKKRKEGKPTEEQI